MQTTLFDKAITFTDIHLGLKNNSTAHNEDCLNFILFMIKTAKENGIDTCIFMGDFFHNRSAVNINTLNYGLKIMNLLNTEFKQTYFLVGNHDMYHKNKRDITSINMAQAFNNIRFINTIETIGDCTFIPFLVDDEYLQLPKIKSKYVFGHLELPGYLLNKMVQMPDHGKETEDSFSGCEYVFSGHFHKRQMKITASGTKIVYTGNCFPHNFSDTWDDQRGIMILEHDKEPEFIEWDGAPKYRTFKLTELLSNPVKYVGANVISKIQVDVPCTLDEISFIRDCFSKAYNMREFNVVPFNSTEADAIECGVETGTETVDEIVIEQINAIDSNTLDKNLLLQIYVSL